MTENMTIDSYFTNYPYGIVPEYCYTYSITWTVNLGWAVSRLDGCSILLKERHIGAVQRLLTQLNTEELMLP